MKRTLLFADFCSTGCRFEYFHTTQPCLQCRCLFAYNTPLQAADNSLTSKLLAGYFIIGKLLFKYQSQPIDDKNQQKTLQRDRDDDKLQRHICVDALALEWNIQITAKYMQIYRINDQMSKFTCICILLYNS
ncbi:Hypothetical_protein [Hexamita inflata]|uniref:Hypothetical_protein n=1 Tax=Hexamita inflata TaxID=28002 RepID=A0AA86P8G3_9EUKA|nr:Hypothetical protein HINF_LOCUS20471 [Hexamita inflata]